MTREEKNMGNYAMSRSILLSKSKQIVETLFALQTIYCTIYAVGISPVEKTGDSCEKMCGKIEIRTKWLCLF